MNQNIEGLMKNKNINFKIKIKIKTNMKNILNQDNKNIKSNM